MLGQQSRRSCSRGAAAALLHLGEAHPQQACRQSVYAGAQPLAPAVQPCMPPTMHSSSADPSRVPLRSMLLTMAECMGLLPQKVTLSSLLLRSARCRGSQSRCMGRVSGDHGQPAKTSTRAAPWPCSHPLHALAGVHAKAPAAQLVCCVRTGLRSHQSAVALQLLTGPAQAYADRPAV